MVTAISVHTWADGFGVWRATVTGASGRASAAHHARRAIRAEITERDGHADPRVLFVRWDPQRSDVDGWTFVEVTR